MSVTLDTSGSVSLPASVVIARDPRPVSPVTWSDLSPFCQGYVEAAFASLLDGFSHYERRTSLAGFSDLHPDTLARFMEDCEKARPLYYSGEKWGSAAVGVDRAAGRDFWRNRSDGISSFPKLRLHLSPDGKVLAEEVPIAKAEAAS